MNDGIEFRNETHFENFMLSIFEHEVYEIRLHGSNHILPEHIAKAKELNYIKRSAVEEFKERYKEQEKDGIFLKYFPLCMEAIIELEDKIKKLEKGE